MNTTKPGVREQRAQVCRSEARVCKRRGDVRACVRASAGLKTVRPEVRSVKVASAGFQERGTCVRGRERGSGRVRER